MQLLTKLSATTLFLQELVNCPRQVGAILPSSRNLAAAMARWLPQDPNTYALELGPGTGVVTEALLARGLREDRLLAIEMSPKMAEHLRVKFPRATIITGDAFELDDLLKLHGKSGIKVGVVFSSLPLLNFEPQIADSLVRKIHSILPRHGKLVQYSYHLGNRPTKADAHFECHASDVIWLNLPPARVSVYRK